MAYARVTHANVSMTDPPNRLDTITGGRHRRIKKRHRTQKDQKELIVQRRLSFQ